MIGKHHEAGTHAHIAASLTHNHGIRGKEINIKIGLYARLCLHSPPPFPNTPVLLSGVVVISKIEQIVKTTIRSQIELYVAHGAKVWILVLSYWSQQMFVTDGRRKEILNLSNVVAHMFWLQNECSYVFAIYIVDGTQSRAPVDRFWSLYGTASSSSLLSCRGIEGLPCSRILMMCVVCDVFRCTFCVFIVRWCL